jgi:hypothetical protein
MTVTTASRRHRELAAFGLAVVLALACLFDRTWRFGEVFSPADALFTAYPWAYDTSRPQPVNITRTDEAFYHQPLMATHFDRLRAGDFPDFDPLVLSGTPAFFQGLNTGQAFNPLSLPFYLFDAATAVTLYAPLRLLLAALGMWCYLRHRGTSALASATGGLAFGFNGAFLVWLSAPMPTVALWLPWILLAIDRTVERPSPREAALLAVALGLMFLGAYLPTTLVVMATSVVYACLRWLAASKPPGARATALGSSIALAAGAIAGTLLAAVGLLPMLATLRDSAAAERSVTSFTLPWQNLATFALPDFWGTPLSQNWWFKGEGNYPEFVTYLGVTVLALAGAGLVHTWRRRDAPTLALAIVALGGGLAMYGVPPATWLGWLPGFGQMNPYRWNAAIACATAVLAAIGVDVLRGTYHDDPPSRASLPLAATIAVPMLLGAVAALVTWTQLGDIRTLGLQAFERAQLIRFALVAGATIVLATCTWLARRHRAWSRVALLPLVALVAGDLLYFAYGFNPTIARQHYYPATAGIRRIQDLAAGGRIAPIASAGHLIDGHVWSVFGIDAITGYDFFGDPTYQRFIDRASGLVTRPTRWGYVGLDDPRAADARLLGLLGTTLIVTPPLAAAAAGSGYDTVGELTDGRQVAQEFTVDDDGLRAVDVLTATYARRNEGTIRLTLADAVLETVASTRVIEAADLPDNAWVRLECPPQPRGSGRWRLTIAATGARPGRAATLRTTAGPAADSGSLTIDDAPVERSIWFRAFADSPERVPGAPLLWSGDLNIYRNPSAMPRAWFVSAVEVLPEAAHIDRIAPTAFDLTTHAVLTRNLPTPPSATARVLVIDASHPDRRHIRVHAPQGGVLVVSERYFEGWTAEVDGHHADVVRANAVLLAVPVPPNTSIVTLSFQSPTRRPALLFTSLALAGIALALLRGGRTRRIRDTLAR